MTTEQNQVPWWANLVESMAEKNPTLLQTLALAALKQTIDQLLDRLQIGPQTIPQAIAAWRSKGQ